MKSNYYTFSFMLGNRRYIVGQLAFTMEDYKRKIRRKWGNGVSSFIFINKEIRK
jgi:hypothetical protein